MQHRNYYCLLERSCYYQLYLNVGDEVPKVPGGLGWSIRSWEKMSEVAFERVTPVLNPRPLMAQGYDYGTNDVARALTNYIWADNALEVH